MYVMLSLFIRLFPAHSGFITCLYSYFILHFHIFLAAFPRSGSLFSSLFYLFSFSLLELFKHTGDINIIKLLINWIYGVYYISVILCSPFYPFVHCPFELFTISVNHNVLYFLLST